MMTFCATAPETIYEHQDGLTKEYESAVELHDSCATYITYKFSNEQLKLNRAVGAVACDVC